MRLTTIPLALGAIPALVLLVKTTLLLVAALGITLVLQRASAGTRHLVWLVTLGALLVLPALAAWAPWHVAILPAERELRTPTPATTATPAPAAPVASDAAGATPEPWVSRQTATAPLGELPATGSGAAASSPMSAGAIALAIYTGVALLILAWLAHGAWAVRRIVRNAHPLSGARWRGPLLEVSDRLGLEDAPRLLVSDEARMPFACGLRTPTIVFPRDCESWSLDRRHAVLLHELAHVKRRDLVSHTLGRLACAVYWFHPLAWAAAKRLRAESERACDDLALSSGARASDYAEHLLEIVASVRGDRTPVMAMAMARRPEFEGRMLAILDPGLRRAGPGRRQSLAVAGTVGMIAILVGAATPVARLDGATPSDGQQPAPTARVDARDTRDTVAHVADHGMATHAAPIGPVAPLAPRSPADSLARGVTPRVDARLSMQVNVNPQVNERQRDEVQTVVQEAMTAGDPLRSRLQQARADERSKLLAGILATDTSASLRRIAAWGLAEYADDAVAVAALATALRKDANADVREMAAWALGSGAEGRDVTTALAAALRSDASPRVRSTAAWALGSAGDDEAATALTAALADTSADVRVRAAWAIGSIGPRSAPKELVALLRDADPKVRKLAAWALFNIEDPASADALDAALRVEKDRDLQVAYVRAIAAMGERSIEPLKRLLESTDPEVKATAVRALAGARGGGPWPMPWPMPRPQP